MSLQDILQYIGVVLVAFGTLLGIAAAYQFFVYNIPDLVDDLSGKKRAEAIARMDEPGTGTLRRRSKTRSTTATPAAQPAAQVPRSGELYAAAKEVAKAKEAAGPAEVASASNKDVKTTTSSAGKPSYIPQLPDDEADATSIIAGEEEPTTVMENDDAPAAEKEHASETATMIPAEESHVEEAATEEPTQVVLGKPEWFQLVQKIVLTESTDYVQVERGEGHA